MRRAERGRAVGPVRELLDAAPERLPPVPGQLLPRGPGLPDPVNPDDLRCPHPFPTPPGPLRAGIRRPLPVTVDQRHTVRVSGSSAGS